jgi:hypothetical protein
MEGPEPPVNVRLVLHNGQEVAVDCVYEGQNAQGMHRWTVIPPPRFDGLLSSIRVDAWPARTSISFPGLRASGPR